jgi:hypothetical protein
MSRTTHFPHRMYLYLLHLILSNSLRTNNQLVFVMGTQNIHCGLWIENIIQMNCRIQRLIFYMHVSKSINNVNNNRSLHISKLIHDHFCTARKNTARLCGLVVRVPGYRYRDPRFDSRSYQTFWEVVGLERGPLSFVRITEELLEWKSSGSGCRKQRLTVVGIRCADNATPSISKSWH